MSGGAGGAPLLIPPLNYAMVSKGIYRSGYPNTRNFPFVRSLRLRTVLYVSADPPQTPAALTRSERTGTCTRTSTSRRT